MTALVQQPGLRKAKTRRDFRTHRAGRDQRRYVGILFVLPAFIFIFVFMLYPLVFSGYLSLTSFNFVEDAAPSFIGLDNYSRLSTDPAFITSVVNTFVFAGTYFVALIGVSLGLALLLFQKVRFSSFYRSAIFVPLVVPLSLAALVFLWILQPNFGLLNYILGEVLMAPDLRRSWLSSGDTAMAAIVLLALWATIGFVTVLFLAGLQAIEPEVLEAAEIDGASGLKKVFLILLPNLKESFILTGTWGLLQALKVFIEPVVLTDGGPGTATLVLYQQVFINAFNYFDMGYASAMGYVLGLIIFFFIWVNFMLFRKKADRAA